MTVKVAAATIPARRPATSARQPTGNRALGHGKPMREHDVGDLSDGELGRIKRELQASLALTRPGSFTLAPTMATLSAVEAAQAKRAVWGHREQQEKAQAGQRR